MNIGVDPLKQWMVVPCDQCGDENPKLIGSLIDCDEITCRKCRIVIDLSGEAWKAELREMIEDYRNRFYRPD